MSPRRTRSSHHVTKAKKAELSNIAKAATEAAIQDALNRGVPTNAVDLVASVRTAQQKEKEIELWSIDSQSQPQGIGSCSPQTRPEQDDDSPQTTGTKAVQATIPLPVEDVIIPSRPDVPDLRLGSPSRDSVVGEVVLDTIDDDGFFTDEEEELDVNYSQDLPLPSAPSFLRRSSSTISLGKRHRSDSITDTNTNISSGKRSVRARIDTSHPRRERGISRQEPSLLRRATSESILSPSSTSLSPSSRIQSPLLSPMPSSPPVTPQSRSQSVVSDASCSQLLVYSSTPTPSSHYGSPFSTDTDTIDDTGRNRHRSLNALARTPEDRQIYTKFSPFIRLFCITQAPYPTAQSLQQHLHKLNGTTWQSWNIPPGVYDLFRERIRSELSHISSAACSCVVDAYGLKAGDADSVRARVQYWLENHRYLINERAHHQASSPLFTHPAISRTYIEQYFKTTHGWGIRNPKLIDSLNGISICIAATYLYLGLKQWETGIKRIKDGARSTTAQTIFENLLINWNKRKEYHTKLIQLFQRPLRKQLTDLCATKVSSAPLPIVAPTAEEGDAIDALLNDS